MSEVFENWNRYYEPYTGRYLQPEPKWQLATYVRAVARMGMTPPPYSYAASNPLYYVDYDGKCFVSAYYFLNYLRDLKDPTHPKYGKDKYAHCMANCMGTIYDWEIPCALAFDILKESYDVYIKGRPVKDTKEDFIANFDGLSCEKPTPKSCEAQCSKYLKQSQHFQ